MKTSPADFQAIRQAIASLPADVSTDALGSKAPRLEEFYAPETHAAAIDPVAPIVLGARGTGKSFWAGVLGNSELRNAAATAYPKLGLRQLDVRFGFTGLGGSKGIDRDKLDECVSQNAEARDARAFWWATILRALEQTDETPPPKLLNLLPAARDLEEREAILDHHEAKLRERKKKLLIVYDALDTVATSWPRRRLLTQALLEVVWSMRAYRAICLKLFLRPDQLEDDALKFVELPKLQTGAVRLTWPGTDLYGLLFSRLALSDASEPFERLLSQLKLPKGSRIEILARDWALGYSKQKQEQLMAALAGPFMADGTYGYKKGNTYEWPLNHLGDAFDEVTPRSFLGLAIAAANHGATPPDRAITPDGIRHGLRAASKTRVDQLHQEFPWIKGVLAPLAGLLLPQVEDEVFKVWKKARTLKSAISDAKAEGYLPPFPEGAERSERDLYVALERIGVMMRRTDGRLDMPDLFRVAAKLLKKGGTAPL
ncbi:hypothetical protein P2318_29510 [Myxococcaceae bacterium GXIMD 01537]